MSVGRRSCSPCGASTPAHPRPLSGNLYPCSDDVQHDGNVDESKLTSICSRHPSPTDVADVIKGPHKDRGGRVSVGEFSQGFIEFTDNVSELQVTPTKHDNTMWGYNNKKLRRTRSRASSGEPHDLSLILDPHSPNSSCTSPCGDDGSCGDTMLLLADHAETIMSNHLQEHVCELYQSIHNAESPHLTALFENVVLSVVRDIKQHQYENERLERSYKRDKEQHARHLRQLEEEMEAQMSKVESRVKDEERDRYEQEKEDLRRDLENEIAELTKNVKKLQKREEEAILMTPSDDLKHRVDELLTENRQLRASVTDSATNLALTRSELATSRQQLEEKCYELESEKNSLLEFIREQESLSRQVHLLQDANKKLHDTNDDLRSALDTSRSAQKRSFGMGRPYNRFRNVDFVSDYLDSSRNMHPSGMGRSHSNGTATLADELSLSIEMRGRHMLPSQETCEIDSLPDDLDSGHSTLRDLPDLDSEYEPNSIDEDAVFHIPLRKRNRKLARSEFGSTTESELPSADSEGDMDTEVDQLDGEDEVEDGDFVDGPSQHVTGCSLSPVDPLAVGVGLVGRSTTSNSSRPCSRSSTCSCASRGSLRRQVSVRKKATVTNSIPKPITKPPERMYKVVLAGDAAVGKSSFIMRLCKGKFVNNISSTLGVDFQTKVIEVDGRVIALQLWDTAGQERFRSIAKSYFRRADGVLLLYDCTYERSFVNVRDWVEAVEDGAQKKIPIMFCGNKTDLRDELEEQGSSRKLVKTEEGQRLAKDYEGLFIETSAKDNNNVLEAVTELARMLRTNEDLEVKTVGMQLQDMKVQDKKGFLCCSS